ncbi:TIGR00266 family protein [Roseofilum sp. BLCC_M91]|uniref:TIGR00266 family protein n=1 Tax=Roseofilum halophilum BLCC-M91 TaxID=3022259 RepID=A0ABT7BG80_9CYAN|nr:TIGR00266 family protein [Roseofilum halophilum]MDJ1177293.1 TIGR00266 family protein [Roseofilum halophilum BLCC-M91]
MPYEIRYKPAFSAIFVTLNPGEQIIAEAGAMTSMDGGLSMKTEFSGGFFSALMKKFFGGESLFVNRFQNNTQKPLTVVFTQSLIGDIECVDLSGNALCLQPGAYIASTANVKLGVRWAGLASWFAGEGLFKLKASGKGKVFFGAYGGISQQSVSGEFIVDNSHLVAYSPNIKMSIGLSGGLISSITSGEGFVNRLKGKGVIYLQSRSVSGLVGFLRPKVRN